MFPRGTILIASPRDRLRGKPRPVVVVQEMQFDFAETIVVVPLTSFEIEDEPVTPLLLPDGNNGLAEPSQLMTHRIGAISKGDVGKVAGVLSDLDLDRVDFALRLVLGLG